MTFDHLAKADPARISEILLQTRSRFQMHDPATWMQQSSLARDGKWDELSDLQDKLGEAGSYHNFYIPFVSTGCQRAALPAVFLHAARIINHFNKAHIYK